jgi:hypothetical protein
MNHARQIGFFLLLLASVSPFLQADTGLSAVWANTGEDKVTRDERRASLGQNVKNSIWDGTRISIFGGRNEVVAFTLILETGAHAIRDLSLSFDTLHGPDGTGLRSARAHGNGVFEWTRRPIELFYVRYLQIKGLSKVSYDVYDERHVPERLRRPMLGAGRGYGSWKNRPDHDKFYPDIAVPLELVPPFDIPAERNQSIWVDIYIPKTAKPGMYRGHILIQQKQKELSRIPVQLQVRQFTLPDVPSARTMLYYSASNIHRRYLGEKYVDPRSDMNRRASLIRDRHYLVAHRHRMSLIGEPSEEATDQDEPSPEAIPRLNGKLFTAAHGYDGPGVGVGNNVYSIGTYGHWQWKKGTREDMHRHTNAWAQWFRQHAPNTDYFLYLIDESSDTAQIEKWSEWILSNPGPGREVRSLATLPLPRAAKESPSLDIPTSTLGVGPSALWQSVADQYAGRARKRLYFYNGSRPASGSTAIEDDGIALRQRAWGQYKKKIDRWFFWETTYYDNYQGRGGETNVFQQAHTFGGKSSVDRVLGETGWNYSNGDGVLFYPGTDRIHPAESYNVDGPFASLRLKHWRRGIQDVEYLTLAAKINPGAVQKIVQEIVPKVLWEYGVDDPKDPTYVRTDVSWSNNPDVWEAARARLAEIIEGVPPR